jgi:hypothetical protein
MNLLSAVLSSAIVKKSLCPWSHHIQRVIKLPIVIRQNCFCLSVFFSLLSLVPTLITT